MTFRPGSKTATAGALKHGDTEHKVKVSPQPLSETDRVGRLGSNSANHCDWPACWDVYYQQTAHYSLEYRTAETLGAGRWEETGSEAMWDECQ